MDSSARRVSGRILIRDDRGRDGVLIDGRGLEDGAELSADVCIVGAGAAGITIARALRGSGLDVLVIEGGGLEEDEQIQALYEGAMVGMGTWELHRTRVRIFGGTTHHWAGWCQPLTPEDFEERPYIPESGWPITYDDVGPYYADAAEVVEIGTEHWDGSALADQEGLPALPSPGGRLETRLYKYSPPTRFGSRYQADLASADDVQVVYRANLTHIALTAAGDSVDRLEVSVLDGPSFTVTAGRFVLALGGIENARMLLASDDRNPDGVSNGSGLVGRYFMEHPHLYNVPAWVLPSDADVRFYQIHFSPVFGIDVLGAVGLTAEVRSAEGLPDMVAGTVLPSPMDEPLGGVGPDAVRPLLRGAEDAQFRRFTLRAEQTPFADSRVRLGSSRDALGVRRVELDWQIRQEDFTSYRRFADLIGAELGAARLGRLWLPVDREDRVEWGVAGGAHHMGTTRMGSSASDGVVDANCRSFEVNNLYIAGSSVFRTGGAANPTLTIVALALRLADHLLE
jgi:choline dehydrogenase-like flavoprotein